MKVKNIMFSGFMAAVLAGACGAADAATVLASKEFVTAELGKKQDTLQQGDNIVIEGNKISAVQYDATALTQKVTNLETTVGTLPSGTEAKTIVEYIDDKTKGFESDGVVSGLQTDVETLQNAMGELPEGKTVAQAIADAVYDDTALAGRVSANETNIAANAQAIAGLDSSKAEKSALDALTAAGGKITVLESTVATHTTDIAGLKSADTGLGERLTALESGDNSVTNQIAAATTALEGQINAKADKTTVETLSGDLDALEAAAQTAEQVKNTVEGYGYQTADQVNTAIENKGYTNAIAEAKKAGTDAAEALNTYKVEVTSALNGKVDNTTLNNYYTKSEADTQFLEDAGLENGAAYLVTKNAEGKVVYSEVSVIGENGQTVIGK